MNNATSKRSGAHGIEPVATMTDPAVIDDVAMRRRKTRWPDVPVARERSRGSREVPSR